LPGKPYVVVDSETGNHVVTVMVAQMTKSDVRELVDLIDKFVSGENRSRELANEIEGLAIECFADEPWFDDVSLALAQFVPGGGDHFVDEADLIAELTPAARSLKNGGAAEQRRAVSQTQKG
jgi:hypothetical protein